MDKAERRRRTAVVVARRKWYLYLDLDIYSERRKACLIGRCRILHPFDCGHPRCGVCSWGKRRFSGPTLAELKALLDYWEETGNF